MRRRPLLSLPLLAVVLASTTPALADERPARRVGVNRRGPWMTTSVSLRDLFAPGDTERLRSGFVHRVVIRVELWPDGGKQPLYRSDRHAELLYDLWEERFLMRITDRYGTKERAVTSAGEAIEVSTGLVGFEVAELGRLSPQAAYRLRFRADLNPLDPDVVSEVKRWLVRSPGQGRAGESVFGSVVSIFVNPHIEDSERQIAFWSQPFRVGLP